MKPKALCTTSRDLDFSNRQILSMIDSNRLDEISSVMINVPLRGKTNNLDF